MKVLLLSDGYSRRDDRTRINLLNKLSNHYNLITGGIEKFNNSYDAIIFILYSERSLDWIPDYIYKVDIPKVLIEEDHYTEDGLKSFECNVLRSYDRFDLIVRRHYYKEKQNLNSVWWPFAANTTEFFCDVIRRKNLIGFAGSYDSPYYSIRKKAISILSNKNLLEYYPNVSNYPEFVRSFRGFLTCAGGYIHTPMSKAFEAMLSGTALLTNSMYNNKILFGNNKCYFEYKDDCSDIVEQANIILHDADQVKEVTANAMGVVKAKHTDEHRIKELYNILKALISGKEIPRIWGQ